MFVFGFVGFSKFPVYSKVRRLLATLAASSEVASFLSNQPNQQFVVKDEDQALKPKSGSCYGFLNGCTHVSIFKDTCLHTVAHSQ